jgi:hypothetical protein
MTPQQKESIMEAVRTTMHYCGLAWTAFEEAGDGDAAEEKGGSGGSAPSQTPLEQKVHAFQKVILPSTVFDLPEVRAVGYKCLGQIGDDCIGALPSVVRDTVICVLLERAPNEAMANLRAEAFVAMGIWVWMYPSLTDLHTRIAEIAANVLFDSSEDVHVRSKAAIVVSHLSGKLLDTNSPCLRSFDHVKLLADAAIFCWDQYAELEPVIGGHALRTMGFILRVLDEDGLIMELRDHPDGVANVFLGAIVQGIQSHHIKLRWNAAHAAGEALWRREVHDADPPAARECVKALLRAIREDRIYKVRSRAVAAVRRFCDSPHFLSLYVDMFDAICETLSSAHGDEDFSQFKESSVLRAELVSTLKSMVEKAPCSEEMQTRLSAHRQILQMNGLM